MNFIKRQGVGVWISLGAIVTCLIGFIIYGVALKGGMDLVIASGSQPFYQANRAEDSKMMTMVVTCGVLALVFIVGALVLGQFKFDGVVGKICNGLVGAMRICAPALLIAAFLFYVYGSFTGLGWTFFSNEELTIYPEATAVGKQVIAGIVFFVIAAVAAIVASFFNIIKKNAD